MTRAGFPRGQLFYQLARCAHVRGAPHRLLEDGELLDELQGITAAEAFTMATAGSASVLGMEGQIGRLAPGYRADIVFLDLTRPDYVPLNDVLLQLVFTDSGASVDSVMIDGRLVLDHGRLLTVDEQKVRAAAEAAARVQRGRRRGRAGARELRGRVLRGARREPYQVARALALDA